MFADAEKAFPPLSPPRGAALPPPVEVKSAAPPPSVSRQPTVASIPTTGGAPEFFAPSRNYKDVLPHQFNVVNEQTEGGIFVLKKCVGTMEKVVQSQAKAGDARKEVKSLKDKNATRKFNDNVLAALPRTSTDACVACR